MLGSIREVKQKCRSSYTSEAVVGRHGEDVLGVDLEIVDHRGGVVRKGVSNVHYADGSISTMKKGFAMLMESWDYRVAVAGCSRGACPRLLTYIR